MNLDMIRTGHALALTAFPFRRLAEYRAAARTARASGTGLWAHSDSVGLPVSARVGGAE